MLSDLLVLADLHVAESVRRLALKFIVENGKEIVSQVKAGIKEIFWLLDVEHLYKTNPTPLFLSHLKHGTHLFLSHSLSILFIYF